MKVACICLLIILFGSTCFAFDMKELNKKRELWDMQHISLSCIGTAYLNHVFDMPFWKAALTSLAIGLVWESMDELYQHGKISRKFDAVLDKRFGFDGRDMLRNGVGIAIAFPIRQKIKS